MSARHVIATVAIAAWGTHVMVMWLVYGGAAHELLWACHVAPLLLGLGCALDKVVLTSIAVTWSALGAPLWLGNLLVKGASIEPTPSLVHLGVLALGLAAVRTMGWDRRAWWLGSLALYALAAITRLVPAAERDDVNLVFRVWPGLEWLFPSYLAFAAFVIVSVPVSSYVVGKLLARLAPPRGAPPAGRDASWIRAT